MRITRSFERLAILAVAIGLTACANISYDRDDAIPIPAGATVAFGGSRYEGRENLDPAVDNDIVHRRIRSSLVAQLQSKGFKVVDSTASADFLVRYFLAVRRDTVPVATSRTPRTATPVGPGWGWGWGGGTVTTITPVDFSEVSFVVDLVQRSSGHTAWRAVWRGNPSTRAPTQEQIDDTMARIFSSAPAAR
ncbi:MAG: DUF4136 domain-containing protein [Burkholderiales bacterium]